MVVSATAEQGVLRLIRGLGKILWWGHRVNISGKSAKSVYIVLPRLTSYIYMELETS